MVDNPEPVNSSEILFAVILANMIGIKTDTIFKKNMHNSLRGSYGRG